MVDGARDYRIMNRKFVNALLEMREYNRFSKGLFGGVGINHFGDAADWRIAPRHAGHHWSISGKDLPGSKAKAHLYLQGNELA